MAVVDTIWALRKPWDDARKIIFQPSGLTNVATNVQDAIVAAAAAGAVASYPVPVVVSIGASPYTVQPSDKLIYVHSSGGAITINLPGGASRYPADIAIKDLDGQAATNVITVAPSGGETVDGLAPYLMDGNYSYVNFRPLSGGGYAVQT